MIRTPTDYEVLPRAERRETDDGACLVCAAVFGIVGMIAGILIALVVL